MPPPVAGLPDQTRSLLRSPSFQTQGCVLVTKHHPARMHARTHVLLHSVHMCLVRVHWEALCQAPDTQQVLTYSGQVK